MLTIHKKLHDDWINYFPDGEYMKYHKKPSLDVKSCVWGWFGFCTIWIAEQAHQFISVASDLEVALI